MLTRKLAFPCPRCGGLVLSNGECQCQQCQHIWEGTDYTPAQLEFYGEVLDKHFLRQDSIRAIIEKNIARMECENPDADVEPVEQKECEILISELNVSLSACERVIIAAQNFLSERIATA